MTLSSQLDALRLSDAGCRLAAFGDLQASIVLRSSSAASHPQEYLDELCQQACRGFLLLDAASANPGVCPPGKEILLLTPGEARVFVRAEDGSGDAVLCICDNAESARRLTARACELLSAAAEEA